MASTRSTPACGLLRRRALGTEALYRVLGVSGPLVEVEVVHAPGLERGTRMRLTAGAAIAASETRSMSRAAPRLGSVAVPRPSLGGRLSAR